MGLIGQEARTGPTAPPSFGAALAPLSPGLEVSPRDRALVLFPGSLPGSPLLAVAGRQGRVPSLPFPVLPEFHQRALQMTLRNNSVPILISQ